MTRDDDVSPPGTASLPSVSPLREGKTTCRQNKDPTFAEGGMLPVGRQLSPSPPNHGMPAHHAGVRLPSRFGRGRFSGVACSFQPLIGHRC